MNHSSKNFGSDIDRDIMPQNTYQKKYKVDKETKMEINLRDPSNEGKGVLLTGDIEFRLINGLNGKMICRFSLNTSFIDPKSNTYSFDKWGVDPDSISKSDHFSN